MPRMDGIETTRRLKAAFGRDGVIGLRSMSSAESKAPCGAPGFDHSSSKEAPIEEIYRTDSGDGSQIPNHTYGMSAVFVSSCTDDNSIGRGIGDDRVARLQGPLTCVRGMSCGACPCSFLMTITLGNTCRTSPRPVPCCGTGVAPGEAGWRPHRHQPLTRWPDTAATTQTPPVSAALR